MQDNSFKLNKHYYNEIKVSSTAFLTLIFIAISYLFIVFLFISFLLPVQFLFL